MTLGEIIKDYRTTCGISQDEIASRSKLSKAYISILERNRNPTTGEPPIASLKTINAIAKAINSDFDTIFQKLDPDLKVAIGEQLPQTRPILQSNKADQAEGSDLPVERESLPDLPSNAYPLDALEVVAYNVIGSIAAGYDSTAVEEYTGDVQEVPRSSLHGRSPEDFFVLRVKGNSMYPQFLEGDHVLVLRCDEVDNGTVAVVLYNGDEATLKKVWRGNGYLDLIPINPEYQPRRIEGADLSQCHILGRAAALLRDFN